MTAPAYVLDILFEADKPATMENIIDVMTRSISRELFGSRRAEADVVFDKKFGKACVAVTFKTVEERNAALETIFAEMVA